MRVKSRSKYSSRASKRKIAPSSSASEPKPKRPAKRNDVAKVDNYCWLCHIEGGEKICNPCHRVYHQACLDKASASFSETQACPECTTTTVDGTELNSNRFFNLEKLKQMLDILTRRCFAKKSGKSQIFVKWPEEDRDELFKIIDLEIMLDNIHRLFTYTKPAELYSDVKCIYHNSCIVYGANSDQAKAAENLRRDFKAELLDLEACPECYYYMYCEENEDSFVRLCDSPHDIVWAQLTGHPYWPAKCLKVVKGIAHVRFFGEHEQSNIPISKCLYMSESHPKDKNSRLKNPLNNGPKSKRYESARTELLEYVRLYVRKYGEFPFSPHKTPYKPKINQNEVAIVSTEGSCNRNSTQLKMESQLNEDTEVDVVDAIVDAENSRFQNCVTSGLPNDHLGVPSVDMSFVADEANFNIENVNPVVTSIVSEVTSTVLSSATDNLLRNLPPMSQNLQGFPLPPKRNETVNRADRSLVVANSRLPNEPSMHNIGRNLPNSTDSDSDVENEVQCIGQKRMVEVDMPINPNVILPVLMEENPEFKDCIEKGIYMLNGLMCSLWCSLGAGNATSAGKISKLCVQIRNAKNELKKILEDNNKLKKEKETQESEINRFRETIAKLEIDNKDLREKNETDREKHMEASNNAKIIINGFKTRCHTMLDRTKEEFMVSIREKDQQLRDAEEKVKNLEKRANNFEERSKSLEEENRHLKKELEEAKVEIQSKESKLKTKKFQISPDRISEYKRNHYCYVCEKFAGIVCCLNRSYCSQECLEEHAEEHKKECSRKITSQSFIQQTFRHQTVTYMQEMHGAVPAEDFTPDYSSNSEVPETDSYLKNAQIHCVSALALPSTSQDQNTVSSPRSYTSKGKRRFNK